MDTSKYKALYLQEAAEHLSGIEQGLLVLEKDPLDRKVIDDLFRHYHSIKGMSASMGYTPIQTLSHRQEDLLDRVRQNKLALSEGIISTLLECLDGLRALIRAVEEDAPLDADIAPFLEKIKAAIENKAQTDAPTPSEEKPAAAKAPVVGGPVSQPATSTTSAKTAPAGADGAPELRLPHVMKVEGRVFDDLLASLGDMFMVLSMFKRISHESHSIDLKDSVHMFGKAVGGLHSSILSARMLPVEDLTASLPRVVRDIARKSGKEVELKTAGTEISLDRAILESLGSPLVHIIRNAVDHGIETPDERRAAGKPATATVTIHAYAKRDKAVIEVTDDGRGIDVKKVRAKAIERGVPEGKVRSMTDKEAMMLVCMPGLSSADTVTDTSGRGVGMDVVKDSIEGLGGALGIKSAPGAGTSIIMELPRTTSIVKALLVTVSGEQFLLPLSRIERIMEVESFLLYGTTFNLDGADVPIVPLSGLLNMPEGPERALHTLVFVEGDGGADETGNSGKKELIALKVDDFGEEIDAYVKPLLPPLVKLWGTSGIAIMADGRPVFLLDLQQIISKARAS